MLETAKVDIRRLQLLNDRINQTIDALNQLRLSVHGLQHTTNVGQVGMFGQNAGVQSAQSVAQVGVSNVPSVGQLGVSSFPGVGSVVGSPFGQLAHSTFVPQYANVQQPWTVAVSPVGSMSPLGTTVGAVGTVSPVLGQVAVSPVTAGMTTVGGLNHADLNDPYLALRAAQTFPYLFSSISPVLPF